MDHSELKFIAAELSRLMKDEGLTFSGGSTPLAQPSTRQQRIDLEYQQDVVKAVARMERKAQAAKLLRGQQGSWEATVKMDITAIVTALESGGWVYDSKSETWTHEDVSGLTWAEAVIHDIQVAARWRRSA